VVNPQSGQIIYDKILSADKELFAPKFKNHVIVKNMDKELYEKILNFIMDSK
jgi:esterase/lipase